MSARAPRKPKRRDAQLLRILLLARRLWYAQERRDADALDIRDVLHDALLERYGRDYEEALDAARKRALSYDGESDWYYVTLWPRMLHFAEQDFPGWAEKSRMRSAGISPIRFALASGPDEPLGANRSVLLFRM